MPSEFELSVLTPERSFFTGKAVSVSVKAIDGFITIWARHTAMATALDIGELTIRTRNETLTAFHSKGFMEVLDNQVSILVQACEWPEDIDVKRAEEAKKRAETRLSSEGIKTAAGNKIALSRALTRLKVKRDAKKDKRSKTSE